MREKSEVSHTPQACLLIIDSQVNIRQSENLLIQNLDSHQYIQPDISSEKSGLCIRMHPNGAVVSESPRVSEKLFVLSPDQDQNKQALLNIITSLWEA